MSFEITTSFVQEYSANVFHLSQQKGSRLRPFVRQESQSSKTDFYDRIGAVEAQKKTSRHGDTPQMDTPHSRRACTLSDYEWADLVDKEDKIRTLNDPTNDYLMAAMWSMGRAMDTEVIQAGLGTAYSGEKGTVAVELPNSQKLTASNGVAHTDLNVDTLRKLKYIFDANDIDEELPRYLAFTARQVEAMLGQTEATSADYANVKALVDGKIDTFMGFKFIRTQKMPIATATTTFSDTTGEYDAGGTAITGYRRCMAWAGNGILLAVGADMTGRISERDDKSYAVQAYASMSVGGVRMEEEKVVELFCKESA